MKEIYWLCKKKHLKTKSSNNINHILISEHKRKQFVNLAKLCPLKQDYFILFYFIILGVRPMYDFFKRKRHHILFKSHFNYMNLIFLIV